MGEPFKPPFRVLLSEGDDDLAFVADSGEDARLNHVSDLMPTEHAQWLADRLNAPAPTDALKDERAEFERWAQDEAGLSIETEPSGWFKEHETLYAWAAWQARASASGLSRPGEGDEARFRQALETISALADDAPWSNETGRVKRMGTIARVELERRATPARSTAPSVGLTEEECNFLLVLCSMIRRAIGDDPADRLLAIKRRLNARAFPDSTKETK